MIYNMLIYICIIYCGYYEYFTQAADYCGEKLAAFFGVTSPKYQYILDEIQRRQLEVSELYC